MTNILMHGAGGAMGRVITELVEAMDDCTIVAGVDIHTDINPGYPVYTDVDDVKEDYDAIIDFSSVKAIDRLLECAVEKHKPVVLCTTGLTDEQLDAVKKASEKTAILRSANMSLGINLLMKLVAEAAKVLCDKGFDVEIVEKHHHRKKDAPSGTAIALADSINKAMNNEFTYIYDRSTKHEARDPHELGISSVRAGSIVGDHDVIYAGEDEVITISHTAYSRRIFAKGAIAAAQYMADKDHGIYSMTDVIDRE